MSDRWKTALKRLFVSAAILFGLYYLMSPGEQELDDEAGYEPNSIQQEFMRLAAEKYDYVALGDTDHRRSEVTLFATSAEMVGAVYEGGERNFFLEMSPHRQTSLDEFMAGERDSYNYAGSSMWICSDEVKSRLNENFAESVQSNPGMNYIAADQRHASGGALGDSLQVTILIGVPAVIYDGIYGCVDTPAFIPGTIIGLFTGLQDEFERVALDDRPTAEYIQTHEGGGTIFYGAGHFDDVEILGDGGYPMSGLLEEAGHSVTVINIYADEDHKKGSIAPPSDADAYMYVTPAEGNPDGIYINDPELEALYEQAKDNVAARQAQPVAPRP